MVAVRFDSALRRRVMLAIACAAALVLPPATCLGDEAEMRLRFAWGGGESVAWKGRIYLDDETTSSPAVGGASVGTIESVAPIGLESDSVWSYRKELTGVRIDCPTSRTYEAVDLQIRAAVSANVNIAIGDGSGAETKVVTVPISKLVAGRHAEVIDDRGNQLTIERTPGDRLRVDIQREHLVFSPSESWTVQITPHQLGTSFPTSATLQTRLLTARSDEQRWSNQQKLTIDESGELNGSVSVAVPVPAAEGVYDLELAIVRPRQRSLIPSSEVVAKRRVQFIVVSDTEPLGDDKGWKASPEYEFDPSQPRLFPRLARVAPRNGLKGGLAPGLPRSLGSRDTEIIDNDSGRPWTELAAKGWQAYPLSLARPGEPHILEIEYPGNRLQSLGVSLIEPNSAGNIVPVGVDGMIHVESTSEESQRYRLIFWPRTKQPYLVLTNRHSAKPATYGAFRVFRREGRLPAVSIDESVVGPLAARRFAVARFSRPIFAKVFGATDATDDETGQSLDDWVTFYDGTRRLIEYVRYLGYDAVSITALCDGSAIFPAYDMRLNPKYDTGVYFSNGQDPVRKDVLELMFRLCDRNGIKLVAGMEFTAPFESLEKQTAEAGVLLAGSNGVTTYNPLDPRVRFAMTRFVEQITERYAGHSSFGGLGVTMVAGAPTHLPTVESASDPATVSRFVQEAGLPKLQATGGVQEHIRLLSDSSYRELWLRWRAHQMRTMYQNMAHAVRSSGAIDAKLYLALESLTAEPEVAKSLVPRLPSGNELAKTFLSLGLNLNNYAPDESFVLLRPHRYDLLGRVAAQGPLEQLNLAVDDGGANRLNLSRGSSFYHASQPLRLPDFDSQIPFGEGNFTLLTPQVMPSGPASRSHVIQCLASHDTRVWFDGGWTAVRDQHDWLAPVIDVFRRLPAEPFETCDVATSLGNRLVVRKLSRAGATYAYVVNNSPWPIKVRIQLDIPAAGELKALTRYKSPGSLTVNNEGIWWECALQPFDLVAGVLTSSDVGIVRVTHDLPDGVVPGLRSEIADLSARISALAKPRELVLSENPSFEFANDEPSKLTGWLTTQDQDVKVERDSTAHSGESSLRITNRAPVAWLRSKQFTMTDTGRMLFRIWARTDKSEGQGIAPRLRLLAESTTPGQSFMRQVERVMAHPDSNVGEWRPYDLWIDDLPMSVRNLRVGVDVLGSGTVWLDDAQGFDLTFSRRERNELSKIIALADLQLRDGRIGDCRTSLDQYWMKYVRAYVSPDNARLARATKQKAKSSQQSNAQPSNTQANTKDSTKVPPAQSNGSQTEPVPKTTSAFEKLRRLVPGMRR